MSLAHQRGSTAYGFVFVGAALFAHASMGCASEPGDTTTQPTTQYVAGTRATASGGAGATATAAGAATAPSAGVGGTRSPVAGSGVIMGSAGSPVIVTTAGTAAAGTSAAGVSGGSAAGEGGAAGAAGSAGSATAGAGGVAGGTSAVAGSAPETGSGGAAAGGGAGSGGAAGETHEDLGKGDGSDVVLLGDSWMSNTLPLTGGGISPALVSVSGQRYTNYAVQGTMLLEDNLLFGPKIPSQWTTAKQKHPKTVVMTGGGNDIIQGSSTLQSSCESGGDECKKKLLQIGMALDALWTQMASDGVQDIIYVRYTDAGGRIDPSLQGDKAFPPPQICLSGKVRCHSVPTTDLVPASALVDTVHPNEATNKKIAMRILDLMQMEGIRR